MQQLDWRWLLACSGLLLSTPAGADAIPLAIAPVTVRMALATEFAAVEVSNRGIQATGIEVEMVSVEWSDGQEKYHASTDFIVSPAAFRLGPDKSRLVRFRYAGQRRDTEGFYRLFVHQLPEALPANQVSMVVNIGVPVFIAPLSARPALSIDSQADPQARSQLRNTGNVTLVLLRLEGAGCPEDAHALLGRVSPQQKFALKGNVSQCATGVQTDHGLIPLSRP